MTTLLIWYIIAHFFCHMSVCAMIVLSSSKIIHKAHSCISQQVLINILYLYWACNKVCMTELLISKMIFLTTCIALISQGYWAVKLQIS